MAKEHKILVVEDDLLSQQLHQVFIEKLGYRVDVVADGHAAIDQSAQEDYATMVLDHGLPNGMTGKDVITAIRSREKETKKHLPIMLVTAHGDEPLLKECYETGADTALIKPISPEQFRNILALLTQLKPIAE